MSTLPGQQLLAQFERVLQDAGIWMIYTRSDPRFRCRACYDPNRGDSPPGCLTCFGTGFQVQLERWKVFPTHSLRRSFSTSTPLTEIGWTPEHTYYVFSQARQVPRIGDLYFQVEWNVDEETVPERGQPLRIAQAARVTFVDTNVAGRPIYHIAHCDFVTEASRQYLPSLLATPLRVTRR